MHYRQTFEYKNFVPAFRFFDELLNHIKNLPIQSVKNVFIEKCYKLSFLLDATRKSSI